MSGPRRNRSRDEGEATRLLLVDVLNRVGRPLSTWELAPYIGRGEVTTRRHARILAERGQLVREVSTPRPGSAPGYVYALPEWPT